MANLYTCLDELGETEQQVFSKLVSLGITGAKRSACHCPVANYLVSLGFSGVSIGSTATTDTQRAWLPEPVRLFAAHFDEGRYPEIDAATYG